MIDPTAQDMLHLFAEQTRDHAIILADAEGHIVWWGPGAELIFGYRASEATGHHLAQLFSAEDVARGIERHEREVAVRDGRVENDRWLVRKDGSRFWAIGVLIRLRAADGQVVGFAKVLRDG